MNVTPIVLLEDHDVLALTISTYLQQAHDDLECYGLHGLVQLEVSGRGLRKWLDEQPDGVVRLLLLDYSIIGGSSVTVLKQLRDSHNGSALHPALHPTALVIGLSADQTNAEAFRAAHADGFISKYRPAPQIVADILMIVQRHQAGEAWVELLHEL